MGEVDFEKLQSVLEAAVRDSLPAGKKVGVAFSGGLDSGTLGFLAQKLGENVELLVVGTPGSLDMERAAPLAKEWNVPLHVKTLSEGEIEFYTVRAYQVLETDDFLQTTLGSVNLAIMEWAKVKGIEHVIVGSGADELFAGYAAFEKVRGDAVACEKLREEKVRDVEWHDVAREEACAKEFGITLHAPYLDEAFMQAALEVLAIRNLDGKYGSIRKSVLRELAEKMGVPEAIVKAPKKAMQYGSGIRKVRKD